MLCVAPLLLSSAPPVRRTAAPQRRTADGGPSPFAAGLHAAHAAADARFRAWPALNDEATRHAVNAGRRYRLHLREEGGTAAGGDPTAALFSGGTLMGRFGLALAARRAVDRKEFFEATEFFARVRSHLKSESGTLVDAAGGHGLVGALAAVFKFEQFGRVQVHDPQRPKSFDAVAAAAAEVAPWAEGRVVHLPARLGEAPLPRGCAVVGVHGCGTLTDRIIDAAAEADARSIALMPCCYSQTAADAPEALRRALGVPLASDVHRTYRLEKLGYTVRWSAVPLSITPMNRIIIATR